MDHNPNLWIIHDNYPIIFHFQVLEHLDPEPVIKAGAFHEMVDFLWISGAAKGEIPHGKKTQNAQTLICTP